MVLERARRITNLTYSWSELQEKKSLKIIRVVDLPHFKQMMKFIVSIRCIKFTSKRTHSKIFFKTSSLGVTVVAQKKQI